MGKITTKQLHPQRIQVEVPKVVQSEESINGAKQKGHIIESTIVSVNKSILLEQEDKESQDSSKPSYLRENDSTRNVLYTRWSGHSVHKRFLAGFYPSQKSFWSCTHVNSCQKLYIIYQSTYFIEYFIQGNIKYLRIKKIHQKIVKITRIDQKDQKSIVSCYHMNCCLQKFTTHQFTYLSIIYVKTSSKIQK